MNLTKRDILMSRTDPGTNYTGSALNKIIAFRLCSMRTIWNWSLIIDDKNTVLKTKSQGEKAAEIS